MSATPRIPDVALINLSFLLALKEAIGSNPERASCQFHLLQSDVDVIKQLGVDDIWALVFDIPEPLVKLRFSGQDLVDLIKTPRGVRHIFAAVRNPVEDVERSLRPKSIASQSRTRDQQQTI